MHKPIKYAEKALTYAAGAAWFVFDKLNRIHQNPGFVPKWSDKPLLKSWEKPGLRWAGRARPTPRPRCAPSPPADPRRQRPSRSSTPISQAKSKPKSSSATAKS